MTVGFDIQFNFINAPTASQEATFEQAALTWESLITGYQDTVSSNVVTIDVNLSNIDGPGGTLGSAGPTGVKITPNFLYANTGTMTFDTSDTAALEAAGTFDDVILHEMGHVLGIGTLWSSSAISPTLAGRQELYVDGSGEYTGAQGLANYNAEFQQNGAFVPVELGGGPGTEDGHWNEVDGGVGPTGIVSLVTGQDLRNELLTGWLNPGSFISSLTVGSFVDLGYTVIAVPVPEPSGTLLALSALLLGTSLRRR